MDKNEFYKQLMENYTFDTEKIKCNAKRAAKRSNTAVIYKWVGVASAAVLALSVGGVSLISLQSVNPTIEQTDPAEAYERMKAAEANIALLASQPGEDVEMYVSFSSKLSYNEALMAFSAISDGDIDVYTIFTDDGKHASTKADIDPYLFEAGEKNITGAKIVAPGSYYKEINDMAVVSLVELASDGVTDDTFVPIHTPDGGITNPPPAEEGIQITLPDNTTAPVSDVPEVTTDPAQTTPDETVTPPVTEKFSAVIPVIAESVTFINDDTLVVLTATSVELYRIDSAAGNVNAVTKFYVNSPKISWSSSDNSQMFITACDQNALRTKLFYADGSTSAVTELDVSSLTTDSEIATSIVSTGDITFFKTVSLEKTRIYSITKDGNVLAINQVSAFDVPVTLLAYAGGKLYYSTSADSVTISALVVETGETEVVFTAEDASTAKYVRAAAFDRAAITLSNGATYILSAPEGIMTPFTAGGTISFSDLNSTIFGDEDGFYCISAGSIVSITADQAADFFTVPTGSSRYIAAADAAGLTVTEK